MAKSLICRQIIQSWITWAQVHMVSWWVHSIEAKTQLVVAIQLFLVTFTFIYIYIIFFSCYKEMQKYISIENISEANAARAATPAPDRPPQHH